MRAAALKLGLERGAQARSGGCRRAGWAGTPCPQTWKALVTVLALLFFTCARLGECFLLSESHRDGVTVRCFLDVW